MSFNVHTTYWTELIRDQPLVHAIAMEQMHARQATYIVLDLKLRQANGALFTVIIRFAGPAQSLILMGQCVRLDYFLRGSTIGSLLNNTHKPIQTS